MILPQLELLKLSIEQKNIYQPVVLRLTKPEDRYLFNTLISDNKVLAIYDEIETQIKDLIKCKNPSIRLLPDDYNRLLEQELKGVAISDYGVWVYYPWSQRMVHLLDEGEFLEVRTNRNQYKISKQERDELLTKKIGIVGLSVGHSIALTIATERGCGELRLADFDALDLSNLNRIRTGIFNLDINKVVIAAREIAEIDPFLKVTCFFDGLTEENIDRFFTGNGQLDLFIDECDSLDMKIISRYKARALKIPVLMDTSDRGMLDIERFDIEPERPLLHGTAKDINPDNIKELSNEDKVPVILQMLGAENISTRGKASMVEVQQSINTWPQLASSIALGGGITADISRRLLLNQNIPSGRYYIDLDTLIPEVKSPNKNGDLNPNPFVSLNNSEMNQIVNGFKSEEKDIEALDEELVKELVNAATLAPSTGNDQPWKWLYQSNVLFLFHDEYRSYSFGDFQKTASYISFGAAFENLYIKALNKGLIANYQLAPIKGKNQLVAAIVFKKSVEQPITEVLKLDAAIPHRLTNRNPSEKKEISNEVLQQLAAITQTISNVNIKYFTEASDLKVLAKVIGACDRVRLLNLEGHHDFVHREMRWTSEEAENTKDGIDIKTLGLGNSQLAALSMIKDAEVIKTINKLDGGKAFDNLALKTVSSASAMCLITVPKYQLESFFTGGRAMERFWLAATNLNLAIHPLISPLYLFSRLIQGNGEGLNENNIKELTELRKEFVELTGLDNESSEVFLTKIYFANTPELKAHRLPLNQVLFFNK